MRSIFLAFVFCAGAAAADEAPFKKLGAMIDVSRGRVLTVEYLKGRFERMSKMGYNAVMLYTEDTFKLEGEPKWGYMRGGYTKSDIRELKSCADNLAMEFIPCIQTLGHLEHPLEWKEYADVRNTDRTLLVGEEKTYALIEKMISFWADAVGGRRIHVGMDEAHGFEGGRYAEKHGKRSGVDVFLEHLARVNAICAKYGFEEPIIWSDMFYRLGSANLDYYDPKAVADPALAERIPKNIRLCYWDYYHSERKYYEGMIDGHRKLCLQPILAGGIQVWQHFLNDREKTLATMTPMVAAAKEKRVEEFFFTIWGDDGGYAIPAVSEEGLFACAELAYGRTAEPTAENSARFKAITGLDYAAMARIGDVNRHYADEWPDMIQEASILYDDPLYCANYRNYIVRKPSETKDRRFYCALYKDAKWRDDGEKVMADYRRTVSECAALDSLPAVVSSFLKVLSAKVAYEADILGAWKAKDCARIERIVRKDLPELVAAMKRFCADYRADWYATSKPFGYETIQKRNAAQLARLEEALLRLEEYLAGKVPTVPELDEAMQPYGVYQGRLPVRW